MKTVLKMELKKAFSNKLFLSAVAVAGGIALISAIYCIISYYRFGQLDRISGELLGYQLNPELPASSLFTQWIGKEFISPAGALFYLLMPLFASLGYGWSYCTERASGYLKNIATRTDIKHYFTAKYIAVFLSGGAAVTIPLLLNIMVVAAAVPAIKPDVIYDVYYGVHPMSTLSPLFYRCPFAYIAVHLAGSYLFAGLMAVTSICMTFIFHNKFAVTLFPTFLFLLLHYLSGSLPGIPSLSPIQFLHSGKVYVSLWVVLLEALLLFSVTYTITAVKGKKNDIF